MLPAPDFLCVIFRVCYILVHNHPSGDHAPSRDDEKITREFAEAGRVIGIEFLDHIIIGANGGFTSLKEKGNF